MGCCGFSESWPGTCHHSWSTYLCPSKAGAMAVAWSIWGRQICGHVWWSTHRDGSTEVNRYSPPRQWLDGSFGGSRCSFVRHCRVPSVSIKYYKDSSNASGYSQQSSITWKLLTMSTAMNRQITVWMYSVLRGGVHDGKTKVHSFTSGMWCFLWS